VALTKCEGLDEEIIAMQIDELRKVVPSSVQIFAISAAAHQNCTEVLRVLRQQVADVRAAEPEIIEDEEGDESVITLSNDQLSEHWEVEYLEAENLYQVIGEKIEKFARRTNYDQFESVNRLRDIMKRMGVSHELRRAGAVGDSNIRIGDSEIFTLVE
jgi:GTP-binding protein